MQRGLVILQEIYLLEGLRFFQNNFRTLPSKLSEDPRPHVHLVHTFVKCLPKRIALHCYDFALSGLRVIHKVLYVIHQFLKLFLMSLTQNRVGAKRLEILGYLLQAEGPQILGLRVPAEVDSIFKELIEVKVVLQQKRNTAGVKHHCLVADLALGPHVETERPVVVLLRLLVPLERADADLKGYELVNSCSEFLILLLISVILTGLLLLARGAARKLRVNRNEVGLLDALHDQR